MDAEIQHCDELLSRFTSCRNLTTEETALLQANYNTAKDWSLIRVVCDTELYTERIRGCCFNGKMLLGNYAGEDVELENMTLPLGLYNTCFAGTCILLDCLVMNTTVVCDTFIHPRAALLGCGVISADIKGSSFANQHVISIGSGRSVPIDVSLSYSEACQYILQPRDVTSSRASVCSMNILAAAAVIQQTTLTSCYIGPSASIISSSLTHTTIASTSSLRSIITSSTITNSIIHAACRTSNTHITSSLLYPSASAGTNASIEQSILAPDSSITHGECSHSIVGPFIGFHHSSLLVASLWIEGRGNIAYGAMVGANHTGRMNDQEAHIGEGCFFGLGAKIKFPLHCIHSPYSIFAGVTCLPQRIELPFSLIVSPDQVLEQVSPALNVIKPGWVLYDNSYMPERCEMKYRSRRKSPTLRTDALPVFRPRTVHMMQHARKQLQQLLVHSCGVYTERQWSGVGKNVLYEADARRGIDAYTKYIRRYALLEGLVPLVDRFRENITSVSVSGSALLGLFPTEIANGQYDIADDLAIMDTGCDMKQYIQQHAWRVAIEECAIAESSMTLKNMLAEAVGLAEEHANNVLRCRQKDVSRGNRIISDYEQVTVAPHVDPVVVYAQAQYQKVKEFYQSICDHS